MPALTISKDQAPGPAGGAVARVLLVEPDEGRAQRLTRILADHVSAELRVVSSAADAVVAMRECLPDLVLTTAFLSPPEETLIRTHLRQVRGAAHVQVVTVPPFITGEGSSEGSPRKVLTFLGRRTITSGCGTETVIDDITAYLEQSRLLRHRSVDEPGAPGRLSPAILVPDPATAASRPAHDADDRRRALRRRRGELPWLSSVQLPWGAEVKVLDISASGVLLESSLRLVVGSTLDLQLVGQDGLLRVPAKMVRSEISGVDGFGVRYRAAAAFVRDLQIPGLLAGTPAPATPRALGEVLTRVLAEADGGASAADIRARFEREVRALLPVRDVQLRLTPVIESFGTESVLFAVPQAGGASPILQVTFHRNYEPTAFEFRLLKAAAGLAGVVLQFAPLVPAR